MTSTVTARPTHYDTLGLKPGASDDEIRRAFAREMSAIRPRAFGGIADVSIAYETLRDPIRRRAYDDSIGISPKPTRAPKMSWQASPYLLRASARPSVVLEPAPRPRPDPTPEKEPRPELAERKPTPDRPETGLGAKIEQPRIVERAPSAVEDASVEWRRPAIVAGGAVLAVGLVAAWAGSLSGHYAEPQPPKRSVQVALTPAEPFPIANASAAVATEPAAKRWSAHPARRIAVHDVRHQPSGSLAVEQPEGAQPETAQPYYAAAQPTATETPQAQVISASMPLPKAVIARTIGRIGYACGQVASTAAVEGAAPGVFKVTCTSGHSYQAAPVRGRYHFRRLSGQ